MAHPHFEHVAELLARVRDGYAFIPDADQIYLGREEKDHFWELVGLRLQGCPVVVLAALRFERLERKGVPDSRESLGVYLSTPARPAGAPERRLTALLPHKDQKIPQFLQGLRAGREFAPVSIDRVRVEVAFDFRADNPSALKEMRVASPLRNHYYRTVDGHVLRGESHEVTPVEGSDHRFVAVRSPEQLLPEGVISLPTIFVAHRFVALQVDVTDEAARLAVRNWVPFLPATASPEGLIPMGRKKKVPA